MFLCCNERLSYTAVGAVLIMVFNLKLKSLLPVILVYINYIYCLTLIPERKRSFFNLQTNLLFSAHLASSYPWKTYHSWFWNQAYKNTELFSLQRLFVCTRGQALEPAGKRKKKKKKRCLSNIISSMNSLQGFRQFRERCSYWQNNERREEYIGKRFEPPNFIYLFI